jgi:Cof subfamily protein (haloacid dehalogenase superfamily)
MAVRLIAIDIDGTLLDSRHAIPEENRAAIAAALDAGIEIMLVTGRSFHHARPVALQLSESIVLIVGNGAITKHTDGTTLERRLLDRTTARDVLTAVDDRRKGAAVIFDRSDARQYVYDGIDWTHPSRRGYYERNGHYMTEVSPLEEALTEDPAEVAFNGGVDEMRTLHAYLEGHPVSQRLSLTLTEYEDRDFSLLDVTVEGCSKAAALAVWATRRGLRPGELMAVGDNLNDREMLAFAGVPVVMGNAVEALKAHGWPMTGTHDEAGLAQAIHAFALSGA